MPLRRLVAALIVLAALTPPAAPAARAATFNRAMVIDSGTVKLAVSVDSIALGESLDLTCKVVVRRGGVGVDSLLVPRSVQNAPKPGGPASPLCKIPQGIPTFCPDNGCQASLGSLDPQCFLNQKYVFPGVTSWCTCGYQVLFPEFNPAAHRNEPLTYIMTVPPGATPEQQTGDDAVVAIPGASPSLIAYDGFDYAPAGGQLDTYAPGGHGWYGTWSGTPTVQAAGMAYAATNTRRLATGGGALACTTGVNVRALAIPAPLGSGTGTVWFGMLARQASATVAGTWAGLTLPCTGPNSLLFFGKPFGRAHWGTDGGSLGSQLETTTPATQQAFLVMRVDFKDGLDDVYLWVNPLPGIEPSIAAAAIAAPGYGDFQGITAVSLASNTAALFDELRIGGTYADVAPRDSLLWAGNVHYPAGGVELAPDLAGHLAVSNIGGSGDDGFDLDTGALRDGGIALDFADGAVSLGAGYRIEATAIGDIGESTNVVLGNVVLSDIGGGQGQLDLTLRPELASTYDVLVYLGSALVYSAPGQSGLGITIGPAPQPALAGRARPARATSPGDPYGGLDVTIIKHCCRGAGLTLTGPSSIGIGPTSVVGDRVLLVGASGPTTAAVQHTLALRVKNAAQFALAGESGVFGDQLYQASDSTALAYSDAAGGGGKPAIRVSPGVPGGRFGIRAKKPPGSGATTIVVDLEKTKPTKQGSETRYKSRGKLGDTPDQPLGDVWWSLLGGVQALNADFTAVGASGEVVEVYSGGTLVSSTLVSGAGVVALLDSSASVARVKRTTGAPFEFALSAPVAVTPTGAAAVVGNRIRVGPTGAAPQDLRASATAVIGDLTELEVLCDGDEFLVDLEPASGSLDVAQPPVPPRARLAIERVHSNPSARGIRVTLALPSDEPARVEALDLQGRRVREVRLPAGSAGLRVVDLDPAASLPAGVYLLRVSQGVSSATGRAVIIR